MNIMKKILHGKVVKHWKRLPRGVESPSLASFKNLQVWCLGMWWIWQVGLKVGFIDLEVFSNPNDPVIL